MAMTLSIVNHALSLNPELSSGGCSFTLDRWGYTKAARGDSQCTFHASRYHPSLDPKTACLSRAAAPLLSFQG